MPNGPGASGGGASGHLAKRRGAALRRFGCEQITPSWDALSSLLTYPTYQAGAGVREAACPLPPSVDIRPGGQSVGQAAPILLSPRKAGGTERYHHQSGRFRARSQSPPSVAYRLRKLATPIALALGGLPRLQAGVGGSWPSEEYAMRTVNISSPEVRHNGYLARAPDACFSSR
jgi:hypothetical protein